MGTAIKHPMPDRVKPSFVIFDIWALWRSGLKRRVNAETLGRTFFDRRVEDVTEKATA